MNIKPGDLLVLVRPLLFRVSRRECPSIPLEKGDTLTVVSIVSNGHYCFDCVFLTKLGQLFLSSQG